MSLSITRISKTLTDTGRQWLEDLIDVVRQVRNEAGAMNGQNASFAFGD
jgi:hypothetical protein